MADNLDLLFRIRGDATGAKNATEQARQAVHQLRTSTTSDLRQIQSASTQSLGAISQSLTQMTSRIPVLGNAVSSVAGHFSTLTTAATGSATSMGLLAGASVIAVAGLTATAKAIFDITVAAAEFQGKMFDLSQQTGVSVETLSTLEIVAKTTGGSIDSITASLGIFQKKLEDALDPTSKEAALLKSLGIETNNTEEALRQALSTLAAMPEGFQQTALALELFGRGGKQILAILKEMGGDLDGATEKFREMGILISTDAAKAADKFNDQLALLGFQIRSVTAIIGNEAMPEILRALTSISDAFKDNQSTITAWTRDTADAARGALILADAVRTIGTQITGLSNLPVPGIIQLLGSVSGATGILRGLRSLGTPEIGALPVPDLGVPLRSSTSPSGTTINRPKGGGDKARADAERRAAREIALIQRELEESTRVHRINLERERELDLRSIEDWKNEAIDQAFKYLASQQAIFEQEKENAQKFIKNKQDLSLVLREIDQKDTKAQNELFITLNRVEDEAKKRRDKATLETERQLSQIRVAQREGEIERIGILLDRQAIQESDAITRILEIEKDAHAERILLINTELALQTTSAARAEELTNQKAEAEQRYTDKFLRLTRERIDALNEEAAARGPGSGGIGEPDFAGIGARIESELGPPPEETFNAWKDAFTELKNIGANAMADLAFGVGSLIENWVLLGETGPKAMRKLVASVLAGVAAQAAVKAIYELAEGFAALFVNPAAAAAHFTSAAIFGSIAGVAAIAGRAVAGDAFQRHDKQSAGGAGAGGGPLQTIVQDRNRRQVVEVRLVSDLGELDRVITASVVRNVGDGGEIREVISNDGRIA